MVEIQRNDTLANTGRSPGQFGGNGMSGDTTYTQQMRELEEIRRDAEAEVNDVRRKRMVNRLDVLMSLGLFYEATIDGRVKCEDRILEELKQKFRPGGDFEPWIDPRMDMHKLNLRRPRSRPSTRPTPRSAG